MGRIVITENVTLDGVIQDPTGEEGFRLGGWFARAPQQDHQAFAKVSLEEALGSAAMLLGARSYEWFAARWPDRPGAWAQRLNTMPKYVVSSTLDSPGWTNTTVLRGDAVDEITTLTRRTDGDIVVYASAQLVRTLLEHDLVDELRLIVHPVILGAGTRLYPAATSSLRLLDAHPLGDTLALLTYARATG